MQTRICEHCGNEVPENAHFCNQCGAPIPQSTTCPFCESIIPVESKFCPKCGRPLVATLSKAEERQQPEKNDSQGWNFNEEDEQEQNAKPQTVVVPQNSENEEPEKKRRNNGPLIAAIITAIIIIVAGFFFFNGRSVANGSDVDTVEVPISPDEAAEILRTTLNKENRLGDLADVAFALEVNPDKGGEKQIAGVTYYSSTANRSFYKVYTITRDSLTSAWRITYELNRTVDKHWLNFNPDDVVGAGKEMPQHVTSIEGKDYLYFAYGALPQSGTDGGEVVLCLYEAQTSDFITVTYAGEMVQRDGKQLVYGKTDNVRQSAETEFLVGQAETATLIYHPTPEELELEKAENATRKWAVDNADNMKALLNGETGVPMKVMVYDKPIFSLGDSEDGARIENENLIVVADDKGAVFGFSKTKRRYFVVYAPQQASFRSSVQFTSDGSISVDASALHFVFDPRHCTASPVTAELE